MLSAILHDWDDAACARILGSIARAAGSGARLVLAELVMPPGEGPHFAKVFDLTMLGMLSGKERSEREWAKLLAETGFVLDRVGESASPFWIIEATRAWWTVP